MIRLKWNLFGAVLALVALLTACGADSGADIVETPQSSVEASSPVVEPIPWVTEVDEVGEAETPVPTEPVEEPFVPCTVGLMPASEEVDGEWFADAVFLGDSRTDGLQLYSGIKGADFFSYKGLSVFSIDEKECINLNGEKVTVLDALARKQYGKVYIMLGINELGYKDPELFRDAYIELVMAVREIQPDADIYLQLQPPANEKKAAKNNMGHVTNERILEFNAMIAQVAQTQETGLVDVWEALVDEEGKLPSDLTSDGVHMVREGYQIWYAYLRTHTGTTPPVVEEPEEVTDAEPEATEAGGDEETVAEGTEAPAATQQPAPSEVPEVTSQPAETQAPLVPEQPVETEPAETVVPVGIPEDAQQSNETPAVSGAES